jgi:hypothetical protein
MFPLGVRGAERKGNQGERMGSWRVGGGLYIFISHCYQLIWL